MDPGMRRDVNMPELPEVETVLRGLKPVLEGSCIERVAVRRADLRFPIPKNFAKNLKNARVTKLERRSKYMLWHIMSGNTPRVVLVHLGMSGSFKLHHIPQEGYATHDHVVWYLADGRQLVYHDPRRFGIIDLCDAAALAEHKLLKNLGPEPLSTTFNAAYLIRALKGKSQAIKPALMDAKIVVGVGNIYASEACFLAGIHPAAKADKIACDKKQAEALVRAIKRVLRDAIKSGGSSLRDFWHVDGKGGYFQHRFNVYNREGEACRRCGGVISRMTQAGRSSFFCQKCQAK